MLNVEEHCRGLDEGPTGSNTAIPTNMAEILRQPIFGNPLILNQLRVPLGLSDLSKGNAFAHAGCT
jgi:hypothetical protein